MYEQIALCPITTITDADWSEGLKLSNYVVYIVYMTFKHKPALVRLFLLGRERLNRIL